MLVEAPLSSTDRIRMDRQELFLHHVNRLEVPDYYQVIKHPMCWSSIDDKLEANEYRFVHEFKVSLQGRVDQCSQC